MNISVGLMEAQPAVEVEVMGTFTDVAGRSYPTGRHRFTSDITLNPREASSSAFALDNMTIGIGFHWERKERQVFRGALRIISRPEGLTVINDVPLEEYVMSVISSEMSASCPLELLKAHSVISRSWLLFPKQSTDRRESHSNEIAGGPQSASAVARSLKNRPPLQGAGNASHEILRW